MRTKFKAWAEPFIKEHPEDKAKYQTIIDRFKIADTTARISEQLDNYNQIFS